MTGTRFTHEWVVFVVVAIVVASAPFFFGGVDVWGRGILTLGIALTALLWLAREPRLLAGAWWKNVDFLFLVFLSFAALSLLWSPVPGNTLEAIGLLLLSFLAFHVGKVFGREPYRRAFATILVAVGVAIAIVAFVQYFLTENSGAERLFGVFKNADGIAAALLLPLLLSYGLFVSATRRWARTSFLIASMLLTVAIALTIAVPELGALLIALVVGAFLFPLRPTKRGTVLIAAFVLVSIAALFLFRTLSDRLSKDTSIDQITALTAVNAAGSFDQRRSFVQSSLSMAKEHPLTGVGFGTWADYYPQYTESVTERTAQAHGLLHQYVGELGWVGLVLFLWLLLALAAGVVAVARRSQSPLTRYAAVGLGALGIAALGDIAFSYPWITVTFWLTAGALLGKVTVVPTRQRPWKAFFAVFGLALFAWGGLRMATGALTTTSELALQQRKDRIDAIATAEVAMRYWPTPYEMLRLTIVQQQSSQFPEDLVQARAWAERTLAHNPLQPATYLLLGRLIAAEDPVRAESLYREGLQVDPHWVPDLAVELGNLLLAQERYDEALGSALEMIDALGGRIPNRDKSESALYVIAADAHLKKGNAGTAQELLNRALELDPENVRAQELLKELGED